MWEELLESLSGVKSLSVQIPGSRHPFERPFTTHVPIILNTKHLELNGMWHSKVIPQFLESFPNLEHLCIQQSSYVFLQNEECSWVDPELVPACLLTNLTSVEFKICHVYGCHIELLEFILENAEALKTVTMIWQNPRVEDEKYNWLYSELYKLIPRASRSCEMYFHGISSRFTCDQ
ncbi:hypothetical protein QVD17_33165 [Tagetes erecta]|uniref:FBD domain-containing protein n=1 Tax=Tagetes erecta TaxID=13708 RepID=A0AAD8JY55_TARER|nr:hypothetical protein QVD17_33165 [Tagetes erecta]